MYMIYVSGHSTNFEASIIFNSYQHQLKMRWSKKPGGYSAAEGDFRMPPNSVHRFPRMHQKEECCMLADHCKPSILGYHYLETPTYEGVIFSRFFGGISSFSPNKYDAGKHFPQ